MTTSKVLANKTNFSNKNQTATKRCEENQILWSQITNKNIKNEIEFIKFDVYVNELMNEYLNSLKEESSQVEKAKYLINREKEKLFHKNFLYDDEKITLGALNWYAKNLKDEKLKVEDREKELLILKKSQLELKKECENRGKEIINFKKNIDELIIKKNEITEKTNRKIKHVKKLELELKSLEKEKRTIIENQKRFEEKSEKEKNQNEKQHREEIQKLKKKMYSASEEFKTLVSKLESKIKEKNSSAENSKIALQEAKRSFSGKEKDIRIMRNRLDEAEEKSKDLKSRKKELKDKVNRITEQMNTMKDTIRRVESDLKTERKLHSISEKEAKKALEKFESLYLSTRDSEKELYKEKIHSENIQRELNDTKKILKETQNTKTEKALEKELYKLKLDFAESEREKKKLAEQTRKIKNENARIKNFSRGEGGFSKTDDSTLEGYFKGQADQLKKTLGVLKKDKVGLEKLVAKLEGKIEGKEKDQEKIRETYSKKIKDLKTRVGRLNSKKPSVHLEQELNKLKEDKKHLLMKLKSYDSSNLDNYKKEIEEQNKIIKNQKILIDKLRAESNLRKTNNNAMVEKHNQNTNKGINIIDNELLMLRKRLDLNVYRGNPQKKRKFDADLSSPLSSKLSKPKNASIRPSNFKKPKQKSKEKVHLFNKRLKADLPSVGERKGEDMDDSVLEGQRKLTLRERIEFSKEI